MLSDEQNRIIAQLAMLRKEVELLESHKTVYGDDSKFGLLTEKQYIEAGNRIVMALEELEEQLGVAKKESSINQKLKQIGRTLNEIEYMLYVATKKTDEELYNLQIQNTIDEVTNGYTD